MLALQFPDCTKQLGPVVPGAVCRAAPRPGHLVRAGSGPGRVQHRHHGALARFQRHLAGGRMGPSVRQPRRDPGGGRLPVAARPLREGGKPLTVRDVLTAAIKAHEIQGVLALREQLQPRRPGPRDAGPAGLDRRRHRDARRRQGRRSSTPSPTPGSTAARCAPTATRPTPARARAGPPATPAAAP